MDVTEESQFSDGARSGAACGLIENCRPGVNELMGMLRQQSDSFRFADQPGVKKGVFSALILKSSNEPLIREAQLDR